MINKTDLAPLVGASLEVMDRDAAAVRVGRPVIFSSLREGRGCAPIWRGFRCSATSWTRAARMR